MVRTKTRNEPYLTSAVHNLLLLSQHASLAVAANTHKRPLYNIGIADMTTLLGTPSWIACTTDTILREKTNLYDTLVDLAPESKPHIKDAAGNHIRATQRDVQRFGALHRYLWSIDSEHDVDAYQDDTDRTSLLDKHHDYTTPIVSYESVEPYSWSTLAQRSISWLSEDSSNVQEREGDHDTLQHLPTATGEHDTYDRSATHAAIIKAYFHNLSKTVVDSASQVVAETSTEDVLEIPVAVLTQAGLDPWSHNDRNFFQSIVESISGKKTTIVEEPVTLCGIRVC